MAFFNAKDNLVRNPKIGFSFLTRPYFFNATRNILRQPKIRRDFSIASNQAHSPEWNPSKRNRPQPPAVCVWPQRGPVAPTVAAKVLLRRARGRGNAKASGSPTGERGRLHFLILISFSSADVRLLPSNSLPQEELSVYLTKVIGSSITFFCFLPPFSQEFKRCDLKYLYNLHNQTS